MGLYGLIFSLAFVAGVIGNLVASLIWASPAGVALARKLNRHHAEIKSQAERQHTERMAQATAHHNELKQQAARHHEQAQAAAEARHEELKAHVATALAKRGRS